MCRHVKPLLFYFLLLFFLNPRTQGATHVKLEESHVTHSDSLQFPPRERFDLDNLPGSETHPLVFSPA